MRRDRGFTLLEVLVVVAIAGLLFVGLSQGTRVGLLAWAMQARRINTHGGMDEVDLALRRMIAQMDPGTDAVQNPIIGNRSSVSFTTELPMTADALMTRRADVWLGVDGSHRLILRWTPHLHAKPLGPQPQPQTAVLLEGVDSLQISYWQPATTGQAAGWLQEWQRTDLPALLRLHLTFSGDGSRRWPDIIASTERERTD